MALGRPGRADDRPALESLEDRLHFAAWYVAPYGSPANSGTLQQPLATIQQAAALAQPGDVVYIRGGTYRETVVPGVSGLAGAPITFEPYNNEPVTIDGADPISGWGVSQGAVYSTAASADLGEGNNQIFVDGRMVNERAGPIRARISRTRLGGRLRWR